MSAAMIAATVGGYAAVLAATYFGLMTLVSGVVSMPFAVIIGKIAPGLGLRFHIVINVVLWLGIATLWGLVFGGPMPLLLFAAVFAVYGWTAKDPNLTPEGFMMAGREQWAVVLAAVAHVVHVGVRWF